METNYLNINGNTCCGCAHSQLSSTTYKDALNTKCGFRVLIFWFTVVATRQSNYTTNVSIDLFLCTAKVHCKLCCLGIQSRYINTYIRFLTIMVLEDSLIKCRGLVCRPSFSIHQELYFPVALLHCSSIYLIEQPLCITMLMAILNWCVIQICGSIANVATISRRKLKADALMWRS